MTSVSFGLAFVAGLASFLSPCVLPVVPGYMTFITGLTLTELGGEQSPASRRAARLAALRHASAFVAGFMAVFMTLGAAATALGAFMQRALPVMQQVGGVVIVLFGLVMIGLVRLPALARDVRVHLARKPVGLGGSVVAGLAFGAGWTPCVGPVLASILLYAGMTATVATGTLLLATYALGLGIPFLLAAVGFNWYLAGAAKLRRFLRPIEVLAGVLLVVSGGLLATGRFTTMTSWLAGFGQWIPISQ